MKLLRILVPLGRGDVNSNQQSESGTPIIVMIGGHQFTGGQAARLSLPEEINLNWGYHPRNASSKSWQSCPVFPNFLMLEQQRSPILRIPSG